MEDDFYKKALSRLDGITASIDSIDGGSHDFTGVTNSLGKVPKLQVKDLRSDYEQLAELQDFDESVFARWRAADLPVMLAAGVLGAFSSAALKDFFCRVA